MSSVTQFGSQGKPHKGKKSGRKNEWRGGVKRNNKNGEPTHDEKLSRKLSNLLRHRVHANGLTDVLRTDGYVPLDSVLSLPQFKGRTVEDVRAVVANNDKQRFSLLLEDLVLYIRANQGHTISGINEEELLTPIDFLQEDPDKQLIAIHGTYHKSWPAILQSNGLSRMSRNHVHLAADLPGESGVISGMRASCELIVYVDVRAATLMGGLKFFTSSNGVILTPGLGENGMLPLDYVTKVVNRDTNESIFPRPAPAPSET
ncbi:hypothetical protein TrLO_g3256 [Triparma laevis f. longispina]|uniref:2'-phosphotransferase n=1 Tax=Triparma laevis f. longispina TaxID=1714387 RepID=A0A9W7A627_9STRA|nr:hypothetical protein TrLO_g3256 [Triparma laevis f. longispina]